MLNTNHLNFLYFTASLFTLFFFMKIWCSSFFATINFIIVIKSRQTAYATCQHVLSLDERRSKRAIKYGIKLTSEVNGPWLVPSYSGNEVSIRYRQLWKIGLEKWNAQLSLFFEHWSGKLRKIVGFFQIKLQ